MCEHIQTFVHDELFLFLPHHLPHSRTNVETRLSCSYRMCESVFKNISTWIHHKIFIFNFSCNAHSKNSFPLLLYILTTTYFSLFKVEGESHFFIIKLTQSEFINRCEEFSFVIFIHLLSERILSVLRCPTTRRKGVGGN